MTAINGGKLDKKISFFESTLVADGAGGFTNTGIEVLILSTWSSIRQIKASRVAENLQEAINAVYEIKLRQRAGFNPQSNYTVKWDGNKAGEVIEITEDSDSKQWVLIVVNRGTGI